MHPAPSAPIRATGRSTGSIRPCIRLRVAQLPAQPASDSDSRRAISWAAKHLDPTGQPETRIANLARGLSGPHPQVPELVSLGELGDAMGRLRPNVE